MARISKTGNVKTFDKNKLRSVYSGKVIDGVYVRNVNNKHYVVKYKGYGIQKDVLKLLVKQGIKKIKIVAKTVEYESTVSTWFNRGKQDDLGHGEQVFLATDFMERKGGE